MKSSISNHEKIVGDILFSINHLTDKIPNFVISSKKIKSNYYYVNKVYILLNQLNTIEYIFTDINYKKTIRLSCVDYNRNNIKTYYIYTNDSYITDFDLIKLSLNRKRKYSICTLIDSKHKYVYKFPMYKEAIGHLTKMSKYSCNIYGLNNIKYDLIDNRYLRCNYIKKGGLFLKTKELIDSKNSEKVYLLMNGIKNLLYTKNKRTFNPSKKFIIVFGESIKNKNYHLVKNINIDMTLTNIFIDCKNKLYVIDNEWTFNFNIPAEYILWRTLRYSPILNSIVPSNKDKYNYLEISEADEKIFRKWEYNFTVNYIGGYKCKFSEMR